MPARLSAFFIWALVAASIAFWGLRMFVNPPSAPAHTLLATDTGPARVDLTRLLGAPVVESVTPNMPQSPALASRFQLAGVMAPKVPGQQGIALLAVDGKMPKPYLVGAPIDGDLVLQSVSLRSASIGPSGQPAAVVLELPALPPPATGTLPAAMVPPAAGPVPPMPAAPMPVSPVVPQQQSMAGGDEQLPMRPRQHSRGMGSGPPKDPAQVQQPPVAQ